MMRLSLLTLFLTGGLLSVNAAKSPMGHLSLVLEQIGEIMIVCESNPTSCACGNGQTLSGQNFFPGIFTCNPTSCQCPNGLTVEGLDTIVVEEVLTPEMYSRMMSLGSVMGYWSRIERQYQSFCNGEAPESCKCANGESFTDFTKNVSPLIICRAEECTCSNGEIKAIPDIMKYSFFARMERICDVKNCTCSTNPDSIIRPPFVSISEFEQCVPTQCTCMDDSVKEMPKLPEMEDNMITSFDVIGQRRLESFASLCDGEQPEFCNCIKREDPLTIFGDENEMKKCYPSTCICADGSVKTAPNRRGSFQRVLRYMDFTYGEEESKKLTSFFASSRPIPGLARP